MKTPLRHKMARWTANAPAKRSLQDGGYGYSTGSVGMATLAGPAITHRTALAIAGVWSAVSTYANTIASLPLIVAERDDRGGRKPARDHWGFDLLRLRPNARSTSMRLRQAWIGHACTLGNGYLEIVWDARGREAKALHLLDPRDIDPVERDGTVVYRQVGGGEDIPADSVLHLAMFGWDGVKGYSPVAFHHDTLGVAAAQRTYQAGLFGNGAQAGGHLEFPGRLNSKQKQDERDAWNRMHQGPQNAGVLGILSEGMRFIQTNFSPQDAELILGCHFSVEEIARIWNLPGYKLGLPAPGGMSDEDQETAFLRDSISPWLVAIEQELDLKLLGRIERVKYFTFHDLSSRVRGNLAAQTAQEQADLSSGVASINDIHVRRGLERVDHPFADYHWISTNNLTPLEMMGESTPPPVTQPAVSTPRPDEDPAQLPPPAAPREPAAAVRGLFLDSVGRMFRQECKALRRAAGKERLDAWADEFYGKHEGRFSEAIAPACRTLGAIIGGTVGPGDLAGEWAYSSQKALRALYTSTPPDEMPAAVEKLIGGWEADRVGKFVDYIAGRADS